MAVRVRQVKVPLTPNRVSRGRLRLEALGHDVRVHGVDIIDVKDDAHPIHRGRPFIGFREVQVPRPDPK